MKTILKIVAALIIFAVIVIIALVVLIGGAAEQVKKDQQDGAITQAQFKAVKMGTPISDVKDKFGKPDNAQRQNVQGTKMDCIYYPVSGGEMLDSYQFCFTDGKLDSKSRY